MPDQPSTQTRPKVSQFNSPIDFIYAIYLFRKQDPAFSLRKRCAEAKSCSQAYISQILNQKRNIRAKNIPILAQVFELSPEEQNSLWTMVQTTSQDINVSKSKKRPTRQATKSSNIFLQRWHCPHIVVKEEQVEQLYRTIDSFQKELEKFSKVTPTDSDRIFQFTMHLAPVASSKTKDNGPA